GARCAGGAARRRRCAAGLRRGGRGPVPAVAAVAARLEYPRLPRDAGAIPGVARARPRRDGGGPLTHATGLPAPVPPRAGGPAARALPRALARGEERRERSGWRYGATVERARRTRPRPEGGRPAADAGRARRQNHRVRTAARHRAALVPPSARPPRRGGYGRPGVVRPGARDPGRGVARVRAAGAGVA